MAKKVLELFAGSRSIGKAAETLGYEVFSSDVKSFSGIDYVVDILDFNIDKVPFIPSIIWASPPCTTYSIAAVSHHRKEGKATSEAAKLADLWLKKLVGIIEHFIKVNPSLVYFIENPRGMMRKELIMRRFPIRHTVTYCQYGESRMKPTDIWTNTLEWIPRPACKNGMQCHEAAPRGSKTGTQGLKNNYERSKIPQELCLEVLSSIK